jgi:hypothetical protein
MLHDIDGQLPEGDQHQVVPRCLAKIADLGGDHDAKSTVHAHAEDVLMSCRDYLDDNSGSVADITSTIHNRIRDSLASGSCLGVAFVDGEKSVWAGPVALAYVPKMRIIVCTDGQLDDDEACTGPE